MMLEVDGVGFGYGHGDDVLQGIGFSAGPGQIVSVLGPNGVGKTTLLKCIDAIYRPRRGAVTVDGKSVLDMRRGEVARIISYVPQRAHVSGSTVFESVLIGRKPHMGVDVSDIDLKIVARTLEVLGIDGISQKPVNEISGGEYQLVQIARALAQQPKVLLLDEPTSSLDVRNQYRVLDTISHIIRENGMCAVMTNHDLNQALRFSERFVLMRNGQIFAAGGREVITPENIHSVYGIDAEVAEIAGRPVVVPLGVDHESTT